MLSVLTLDKTRNLKVFRHEGSIGPVYDPYGYTEVVLKLPFNREGRWYQDGLGCTRWRVEDGDKVWHGTFVEDRGDELEAQLQTLKANLLAKRVFGVRFDDAEQRLLAYMSTAEPDPMGPLSRYI